MATISECRYRWLRVPDLNLTGGSHKGRSRDCGFRDASKTFAIAAFREACVTVGQKSCSASRIRLLQWENGLLRLRCNRPRHHAECSRYHIKDKQRFVVSVVAYDSLPGHQRCHRHSARVGLGQGCKVHANFEMDRVAGLEARRDDDAADGLAQLEARTLGISDRY